MKKLLLAIVILLMCLPAYASDNIKQLVSFSMTGIDGTQLASTQIGTTENGTQSFYPLFACLALNGASAVTVVPSLSIGTNSATYNNILGTTVLTGMTSAGQMLHTNIVGAIGKVPANTPIYVKMVTAATATTATVDVHLFGFYQ
jgi:hypothetical protein